MTGEEETYYFTIDPEEAGERIDRFLAEKMPDLTRSYIQKLVKDGFVKVNGTCVKSNYRTAKNDQAELLLPPPELLEILPENIPLDILYEDEDLLVVNKPKGMVVHPAAGHSGGTLVNAVMYHCGDALSGINGVMRPGIVHRIDKDTSGSLLVCKTDRAHQSIAQQLAGHSIHRIYRAVASGVLKEESGTVDAPVGRHPVDRKKMAVNREHGKEAVTHYKVLERLKNASYIECRLETGRTHQIRVHMASIGHPLLGDTVYGSSRDPYHLNGQALHAMTIGFIHPVRGIYMEFEAPLPEYFVNLVQKLR